MNPDPMIMAPTDRDTLIEIKTELKLFREESRAINNDTKERLILLGANKLEKEAFTTFLADDGKFKSDHEKRLRKLESWGFAAIGGLGVIEAIIGWYLLFKK